MDVQNVYHYWGIAVHAVRTQCKVLYVGKYLNPGFGPLGEHLTWHVRGAEIQPSGPPKHPQFLPLTCWLLSCGLCCFAVLADRWQVILGEFPGRCTQCAHNAHTVQQLGLEI